MKLQYIYNKVKLALTLAIPLGMTGGAMLTSCSDEPDEENYYTFTGEMMSDFLRYNPEYSQFAEVVDRAGLMNLLSTYGHYTCFAPNNTAMSAYLQKRGFGSIDDMTTADCDTLARTHLVNNMYTTADMMVVEGSLGTNNMNRQPIQITQGLDQDSNAVVILNRSARVIFTLQDDSVENGIVQPIDMVLENSSITVDGLIRANDKVSLFYNALNATGLRDSLIRTRDENWNPDAYEPYRYTSDFWVEIATVPEVRKIGFTAFVEPDSVYRSKGVNTLEDMYRRACQIYDPIYPDDVAEPEHAYSPENIRSPKNPLWKFVAYHILTRDVVGYNKLTPLVLQTNPFKGAIGIKINEMDPTDWYETMLPRTMMKMDQATVQKYLGDATRGERFVNRRYDAAYQIRGAKINPVVEDEYEQFGLNGRYFYVDDIVKFGVEERDQVFNTRIRMDFSTIWPEVMTNDIRLNGDPTQDDNSSKADDTFKYGRNYYFPNGYLDNVTITGNASLVYRRPHWNFWSYEGDEWNLFGDYDITFRLPPVPYDGEWQVRMGFCALKTRGVAQIYFDGKPQGIPLDMRKFLNEETMIGSTFETSIDKYKKWTEEEKVEDQKALKNLGAYRGAYGGYHTDGTAVNEFVVNPRTYRIVLCQTRIDPSRDHYLRVRCTTTAKQGNNNEFMMDYIELVPKSVYGVTGAGQSEDDL
ncbi:MAG: fasciclin domain-containing protein [Prevotella sp.]|nr:fasciclin domain-containing protein [Prevotella sp.]